MADRAEQLRTVQRDAWWQGMKYAEWLLMRHPGQSTEELHRVLREAMDADDGPFTRKRIE